MRYILLIILFLLIIFTGYKIITEYPFPSKYYDFKDIKWHFFTKDKKILKEFTKYHFFIKSVHLGGDFAKLKLIEIQTFLPFFIFKFYEIRGFLPQKSPYGISYIDDSVQKEYLNPVLFNYEKEARGGFGWIKTEPEIIFKVKKNRYFEFESLVRAGNLPSKNENFKIKNYDLEIYKASSPHFSFLFPEIEEIEAYYKDNAGFFRIKKSGKEKVLKFGNDVEIQKHLKEEKLSFYLKAKDLKFLKKFVENPIIENLEEIEIKCLAEKNEEKCSGYFSLKRN